MDLALDRSKLKKCMPFFRPVFLKEQKQGGQWPKEKKVWNCKNCQLD